uniref:Malonyl-CoA:ACP transacylase (MAT) domain-containing protein n=1 Tax=Acrobeloides nanus TaxID=290746 RepID=A0A914DRX0_9BILA
MMEESMAAPPMIDHTWKSEKLPRLMLCSGNTSCEIENIFDDLSKNDAKVTSHAIAPYRGFTVLQDDSNAQIQAISHVSNKNTRSIWFLYSGIRSYWPGMGQQLLRIPAFKNSFDECAKAVEMFGIDLYDLIYHPKPDEEMDIVDKMVIVTAMHIVMTELLKKMNIHPDGFIGFSLSEICCGYADDGLTKEQTMKLAYYRGYAMKKNSEKIKGGSAMVFTSWEKIKERCLPGVHLCIHGGTDCTGIAGDLENIKKMVEQFQKENIIARVVDTDRAPHSPQMHAIYDELLAYNKTVITEPKQRSTKWATSVDSADSKCSPEFFTDSACNPVYFYEALRKIPENSLVIEVGPWAQMESMLRPELPKNCDYVGLVKRRKPEILAFLEAIGMLYTHGYNVKSEILQ